MIKTSIFVLLLATFAFSEVIFKSDFTTGQCCFSRDVDSVDKWKDAWVQSKASPDFGQFTISAGEWYGDETLDKGLKTSQDARFYALSSKFPNGPFSNEGKPLVIQFSVKHEQGIDCGGGYVKILPSSLDQTKFDGKSEYK